MKKEIWKKLPGYDCWVSNYGRVKNSLRYIGYVRSGKYPRRCITLRKKNGKQSPFLISVLVAKLFIKNPKNYPYVDHINRDKLDDSVWNLRWSSCSLNNMNVEKKNKKDNLSKFKGVTKRPPVPFRNKPWQMSLRLKNGKNITKSFPTEKEAALAYNKIAKKEYGDFAYLNVV